jgi:hypothetical protein
MLDATWMPTLVTAVRPGVLGQGWGRRRTYPAIMTPDTRRRKVSTAQDVERSHSGSYGPRTRTSGRVLGAANLRYCMFPWEGPLYYPGYRRDARRKGIRWFPVAAGNHRRVLPDSARASASVKAQWEAAVRTRTLGPPPPGGGAAPGQPNLEPARRVNGGYSADLYLCRDRGQEYRDIAAGNTS